MKQKTKYRQLRKIYKKEKKFEVYQRQRFGQTQMNQNKKLNK